MDVKEFKHRWRTAQNWINGRLANIEQGAPLANEAPDIQLELECLVDAIKTWRKEEKLKKLME